MDDWRYDPETKAPFGTAAVETQPQRRRTVKEASNEIYEMTSANETWR